MDHEQEIWRLSAESRALQMLLIGLCRSLLEHDKRTGARLYGTFVAQAFGYADYVAELSVAKLGGSPEGKKSLLDTVDIVEQLRAGIFESGGAPQHDIKP